MISSDSDTRTHYSQKFTDNFPQYFKYSASLFKTCSLEDLSTDPLFYSQQTSPELECVLANSSKSVSFSFSEIEDLTTVIFESSISSHTRISSLKALTEIICFSENFCKFIDAGFLSQLILLLSNPVPGMVLPVLAFLAKSLIGQGKSVVSQSILDNFSVFVSFIFHPTELCRQLSFNVLVLSFFYQNLNISNPCRGSSTFRVPSYIFASFNQLPGLIFETIEDFSKFSTSISTYVLNFIKICLQNDFVSMESLLASASSFVFDDLSCFFYPTYYFKLILDDPLETDQLNFDFLRFLNTKVYENNHLFTSILSTISSDPNVQTKLAKILHLDWFSPSFHSSLLIHSTFVSELFSSVPNKSCNFNFHSDLSSSIYHCCKIIFSFWEKCSPAILELGFNFFTNFLNFITKYCHSRTFDLPPSEILVLVEKLVEISLIDLTCVMRVRNLIINICCYFNLVYTQKYSQHSKSHQFSVQISKTKDPRNSIASLHNFLSSEVCCSFG
ncbi:hypothetical protein GEMRC1_001111 [Eukaryota sp. GEM-RC1]